MNKKPMPPAKAKPLVKAAATIAKGRRPSRSSSSSGRGKGRKVHMEQALQRMRCALEGGWRTNFCSLYEGKPVELKIEAKAYEGVFERSMHDLRWSVHVPDELTAMVRLMKAESELRKWNVWHGAWDIQFVDESPGSSHLSGSQDHEPEPLTGAYFRAVTSFQIPPAGADGQVPLPRVGA